MGRAHFEMMFSCVLILSLVVVSAAGRSHSTPSSHKLSNGSMDLLVPEHEKLPTASMAQAPEMPREAYRLGPKIQGWDEQRAAWLEQHPGSGRTSKGKPRMILVTSSQSEPCPSPSGDHYLLKAAKNKIDYTRLHQIDIYYNMVLMQQEMNGFWIKLPLIRKLMLTHPEAEWIWWMDSDAIFTDMAFEIPLEKYKDHNMIIHGWNDAIYQAKNWVGLNAGIFLLRNCQWTLDFLDMWAALGEDYGDKRDKLGTHLSSVLSGRPDFAADDQSALVYLLSTSNTEELKPKVFLESSYELHGFWVWAMDRLDEMLKSKSVGSLEANDWSFITHFVGCKTCKGTYASYPLETCLAGMERAFNLADNQVLDFHGFEHENLDSYKVKQTRPESLRPLDLLGEGPLEYLRRHPWRWGAKKDFHGQQSSR